MPKQPPPGERPPEELPPDETIETGFYEAPPETQARAPGKKPGLETMISDAIGDDTDPQWPGEPDSEDDEPPEEERESPARRSWFRVALLVALAGVAGGAALAYRAHHRRQVLDKGLARAQELIYKDTYAGYRDAAQLLQPLVDIDPVRAGSLRAFALAMLRADYRDEKAGAQAEALLVAPDRAQTVPPAANLAHAALALADREAGTATSFTSRPGGGVWAGTLLGRLALMAGNPTGALEPLEQALAAEPQFPAALALKGDALRRLRRFEAARAAYGAALSSSSHHARATFGMAKLALGGQAKPGEATPALERLLGDRAGTPSNERARAALHLAALRGRLGDRAGALAALDASGVEGAERAWLEKAVAEEELARAGYRVVPGAPAGLQSQSDDDPYERPPPPKKEVKAAKKPTRKVAARPSKKQAAAKQAAAKKSKKKSGAKKKTGAGKASAAKKTAPRKPDTTR